MKYKPGDWIYTIGAYADDIVNVRHLKAVGVSNSDQLWFEEYHKGGRGVWLIEETRFATDEEILRAGGIPKKRESLTLNLLIL